MSDPRVQKGIRAAQSGKLKRAAEIFQAVLKSDPTNADALNFEGVVQHQLGKSERGISLIRKSIEYDPDNPNAHTNLGNVYKELDRHDDAEAAYRAALALDPINAITLNNIATVQRNSGDLDKAIATLREAIKIAPELAQAYHNLGICLHHNGQHAAAINAYRDSFRHGGGWSDPIRPATLLVTMGLHDEAEAILVDFLESNKNHEAAKFHLAAIRGEKQERASDEYVSKLFDGFAASFDGVLSKLGYNTPMRVAELVKEPARRAGGGQGDARSRLRHRPLRSADRALQVPAGRRRSLRQDDAARTNGAAATTNSSSRNYRPICAASVRAVATWRSAPTRWSISARLRNPLPASSASCGPAGSSSARSRNWKTKTRTTSSASPPGSNIPAAISRNWPRRTTSISVWSRNVI